MCIKIKNRHVKMKIREVRCNYDRNVEHGLHFSETERGAEWFIQSNLFDQKTIEKTEQGTLF